MATLRTKLDPTGVVQGAKTAENAIEGVTRSAYQMEAGTQKAAAGIRNVARSTPAMSSGMRMASMQLSQVAQQGAATGNYLQALAIQAPDLALGFGAVGIAIGALVPILYGVGSAFLGAGDDAQDLTEQVDELTAAVDAYRSATRDMGGDIDRLTQRFGGNYEAGRRLLEIQQQLAKVRAEAAVGRGLARVGEEIGAGPFSAIDPSIINAGANAIADYEDRLQSLIDAEIEASNASLEYNAIAEAKMQVYGEQLAQLSRLDKSLSDLADMLGVEVGPAVNEVAAAMAELSQAGNIEEQVSASERLAEAIYNATDGFSEGQVEAHELYQSLLEAVAAGLELEGLDLQSGIGAAASSAAQLAAELGISVENASRLMGILQRRGGDEVVLDPRDPRYDPIAAQMGNFDYGTTSPFATSLTSRSRGGGGGGRSAVQDLAKEYERLRSSLDPVYRATQQYEASQELLNRALEEGQITQAQYNETLAMAKAQYEEVIAAQAEFAFNFDGIASSMENAFMSIADGTMTAKEAFRSMARDIIAELYRVLVVQQLVGQFDAASGSGSGLMGLFGGLFGMRAEGGNVQAGESYLVGERGPEVFRPAANGQIEQGSQGGVVVHQTFTFQANGDASVKQIIRQAMPEIAEASKAAVMDARQRGGSFAGVFR